MSIKLPSYLTKVLAKNRRAETEQWISSYRHESEFLSQLLTSLLMCV